MSSPPAKSVGHYFSMLPIDRPAPFCLLRCHRNYIPPHCHEAAVSARLRGKGTTKLQLSQCVFYRMLIFFWVTKEKNLSFSCLLIIFSVILHFTSSVSFNDETWLHIYPPSFSLVATAIESFRNEFMGIQGSDGGCGKTMCFGIGYRLPEKQ